MSGARREPEELDSGMTVSLTELVARRLRGKRVVLAVSGGRDSMTLMHAALTHARESVACVASFDHGTGEHSARALALVGRAASEHGVTAITSRAHATARTEAEWRAQRWSFLSKVAREHAARRSRPRTRATIRSRRC